MWPENTQLRGKDHYSMAGLHFSWIGFDQNYVVLCIYWHYLFQTSLTGLDLNNNKIRNSLYLCTETTYSKGVKLETSQTVILLSTLNCCLLWPSNKLDRLISWYLPCGWDYHETTYHAFYQHSMKNIHLYKVMHNLCIFNLYMWNCMLLVEVRVHEHWW